MPIQSWTALFLTPIASTQWREHVLGILMRNALILPEQIKKDPYDVDVYAKKQLENRHDEDAAATPSPVSRR